MMKTLFAILLFPMVAAAQWNEAAYPVTDHPQLAVSNRPAISIQVWGTNANYSARSMTGYPVRTWFHDSAGYNRTTNPLYRASNAWLQARDVWHYDSAQAMRERVIPATPGAEGSAPAFANEPFPQRNRSALLAAKAWALSTAGQFVNTAEMSGGSIDNFFSTNAAAGNNYNSAPMWNETNLLSFIRAPTNYLRYTAPQYLMPYIGKYVSQTVTVSGATSAVQVVTNAALDPWALGSCLVGLGLEAMDTNRTFSGTNGAKVVLVWTNRFFAEGETCAMFDWRFIRPIYTNLTATESEVVLMSPVTNEAGTGARAWSDAYCSPLNAERVGHGTADGCTNSCANATNLWTFAIDCGAGNPPLPYAWLSITTNVVTTNLTLGGTEGVDYWPIWYGWNDCNLHETAGCDFEKYVTFLSVGACSEFNIVTTSGTNILWVTGIGGPGCDDTRPVITNVVTNICITAQRQNEILCIPSNNFPMGLRPTPGALQWLWGDSYQSNQTVTVDFYAQWISAPGFTYQASDGAFATTTSALRLYHSISNEAPRTNLWEVCNAGKLHPIGTAPAMPWTMPFAGTCANTNIGWWIQKARAVMRWDFIWK